MKQQDSSAALAAEWGSPGERLMETFLRVREFTRKIVEPLSAEDCAIQSMEDASPTRWHLAHTTWFFETFLLKRSGPYEPYDERFESLFNSYYNSVGKQFPRHQRGLISRPGLRETIDYRVHVDREMVARFSDGDLSDDQKTVLRIGINHEQQHQELMLTDIKHTLSCNPLDPVYRDGVDEQPTETCAQEWIDVKPGVAWIGHEGDSFCFDNEQPRHRVFLEPFQIAKRCVTNREYMQFIEDGGYCRPEFWLSLGWSTVQQQGWSKPLYWTKEDSGWSQFTLAGRKRIHPDEPVCHVSYFEADAYARWAGCRLATEAEWEHVVCQPIENPFCGRQTGIWSDVLIDSGATVHPKAAQSRLVSEPPVSEPPVNEQPVNGANINRQNESQGSDVLLDAMGNLWEWTSSHYSPYPGYQTPEGALGEYNGKFMCNVFVLKGGSCATPSGHARPTYRNFFSPSSRWQFSGIRLARS